MISQPLIPPKNLPHQEYELWRQVSRLLNQHSLMISAVGRGEVPDGSGESLLNLDDYFHLPGRPGGQRGHGGKGPSENLWLSSTKDSTKGFIFLGNPAGGAFDEVNFRLGINEAAPDARLHLRGTGGASGTYSRPYAKVGTEGLDNVGAADNYNCINEVVPDGNSTYVYYSPNEHADFGALDVYTGTPFTPVATPTGWIIRFQAGRFDTAFSGDDSTNANRVWGVTVTIKAGATGAGATLAGPYTRNVSPVSGSETYEEFEITLTDPECDLINNNSSAYAIVLQLGASGTPSGTFASFCACRVTWLELEIEPSSAYDATPLQRWEVGSAVDDLNMASDGDTGSNLVLSGNAPFFITAGTSSASGLRLYADSSAARLEVGSANQSNQHLYLSGNRASEMTSLRIAATGLVLSNQTPAGLGAPTALLDLIPTTAIVGLRLRAPGTGSADLITVQDNGGSTDYWKLTIAGKMVTTIAPQFDIASAAASYIWTATDADGNGVWTSPSVVVGTATLPYTEVSSTYAITTSDYYVNCTSGTFTATLPTAVGVAGRVYVIKNSGTGVITLATTSSQTIDGGTTALIRVQYTSLTVVSTGANWVIV